MKIGNAPNPSANTPDRRVPWPPLLAAGVVAVVLLTILRSSHDKDSAGTTANESARRKAAGANDSDSPAERARGLMHHASSTNASTASEAERLVAAKVVQYGRKRRELVRKIAARLNKDIPIEVERFFDAIESGRWEEIDAEWRELAKHSSQYDWSTDHWEHLNPFWEAVLDTYIVAEQAHDWPAQQLLDYGNAILDSLKPGMVYVGGTDNGRGVPALLNETRDEQHVVLTQNALADARYLEFLTDLYGDRLATLTMDDSKRAFENYTADAKKRFEHDQKFPDEPKQVRPGENIKIVDGLVQVSGQTAVMNINEKLVQMLMAKNPHLTFALQESFPLRGTYPDALPSGPLMELGARNDQNKFTADRAAESVGYWQDIAQKAIADPVTSGSETAMKSYSHDIASTANLLASHDFATEARQAYELATQLWPANPESVSGMAELLARAGRQADAQRLLDDFFLKYPDQKKKVEQALWSGSITMTSKP